MARILVTDDEEDIVQLISRYAEHEGHLVDTAGSGKEAVLLCERNEYDVIIMLSALGTEYDKLMGFELGIDDYVVKPFSPRELMARIRVVVKRHLPQEKYTSLIIGKMKINTLGRNVSVNGKTVELTAKEYDLLLYLVNNRGIALSRDTILNAVWGYDYCGEERTVDWQVKLLREHLGECRNYIVTLRGVGYKFEIK